MNDRTKWIEEAKAWALENYEKGADTFVECYSTSDWEEHLREAGSEKAAWKMLKRLASVYRERQADARFHRGL